ncbi:MAG: glycosyltransferase [Acidimicrobiales bacterium]
MQGTGADLSLVIPAYNEESRLGASLDRLASFAADSALALEVIVADDGSTDGTAAVAAAFAARAAGDGAGAGAGAVAGAMTVRLVTIAHRGKGAAVRAGLGVVTAPIVGYCDADLSAGPDAIAQLYTEVKGGFDLAIASRALPESVLEVRQPWYRERAGRIFNALLRRFVAIPFHDTQCGLKLFRQEVAAEILRHQRIDGFAFDAELVVLAVRLGFEIKEVPVRWSHDPSTKVSMVRDSLAMSRDIVRIVRRLRAGKLHALGIPEAGALEVMTASEADHWWYVAKRLLIGRYWRTDAVVGRCLDVGCGGGATLAEVTAAMPAFGVDLSPAAVGHGQRAGLSTLARAEAGALPFADGSFSVAFALDVLEHHPVPEQLAREIRRVLTGTGLLVVTVPAFRWMWSYADHVLGHYRRYTRQQLVDELTNAGFTVERATYFHSWLLPLAWVFRRLRSLTGRTETADDFAVPALLNRLLLGVSKVEQRYLASHDLPFGLSVLAVARPNHPAPQGDSK